MEDFAAYICPAKSDVKETAKLLLSLATKARHVQVEMDGPGGTQFRVPGYLHDRYLEAVHGTEAEEPAKPARKGRGRPARGKQEIQVPGPAGLGDDWESGSGGAPADGEE